MRITWLGHATFLIEGAGQTIYIDPYIDPYSPMQLPKATIILISHWHPDHCTRESVERLLADNTTLLGTSDASREFYNCKTMIPGSSETTGNVRITAMPARGHGEEGFVIGFLLEIENKKVYYTSDTGLLPTMHDLKPDVVLIPVGGTTTMTPKQAALAVRAMGAKIAIPAHWGTRTGTRDNAELFKEYLEPTPEHKVVILEPGEMIEL